MSRSNAALLPRLFSLQSNAGGGAIPAEADDAMVAPQRGGTAAWVLPLACLFSGGAALIFENLWFRAAGLAVGNSVWSAAVVTAAFMAGLGLGNLIAATAHLRIRNAIRAYVGVEVAIAIFGLASFFLLFRGHAVVSDLLAPWHDRALVLQVLRSGLALLILIVPATCIGVTLPLLIGVRTRQLTSFGSRLAWLYAWNTLGAVLGSLAAEFVLIGALGLGGTAVAAAACNLIAAGLIHRLGGAAPEPATAAAVPVVARREPRDLPEVATPMRIRTLLVAAMLSGFSLLALEILWFRFLQLFFNGTTKTFALMLALVLLGLSIGGVLAARLCRDGGRPGLIRAFYLAAGGWVVFSYAAFPWLQALLGGADDGRSRLLVAMCAFLMLPICVLSGAQFGLIGQALHGRVRHSMQSTGLLTLANTLGATLGPLVSAFVLLPLLGVERGFFAIALVYGVAAFLVRDAAPEKSHRWVRPLAQAAVFGGVLACFPFGLMQGSFFQAVASRLPGATMVHAREGLSETSFYFRHDAMGRPFYHRLVTHGYSMSSSDPRSKRYMKLFAWLPLALHPETRDALLICFGVGSTARALVDTPELRRIDVVDISRDILQSSDLVFPTAELNPLRDPRVTTRVEDGRFYLQTTERKYDLITGEPPPTKIAGVVNLYTEEFFRLVRQRLNAGGFCSYWLPVYQMQAHEARTIVRAFLNVFPEATLWEGGGLNWILLGRNGAGPVSTAAQFAGAWTRPEVAAEMAALGIESPGQLGATFLADASVLARFCGTAKPLSDSYPHRVSTDMRDRAPNAPEYREIMDADRARGRFESSAWVAASVPAEIRTAAQPLFRVQRCVNYALYPLYRPEPDGVAGDTRDVLATTKLRTLPLWMVGSSPQELAIAQALAPAGVGSGEVEFHLAAGSLVDRNYAGAGEHLRASLRQGGQGGDARLQVLLKTLSGTPMAGAVGAAEPSASQ